MKRKDKLPNEKQEKKTVVLKKKKRRKKKKEEEEEGKEKEKEELEAEKKKKKAKKQIMNGNVNRVNIVNNIDRKSGKMLISGDVIITNIAKVTDIRGDTVKSLRLVEMLTSQLLVEMSSRLKF
ncbi:hypothetical protein M8J77_017016 [Diaphorina citri]|nr:hypothetical protein M8J77_017016 [Diaphorina citri]